MRLSGRGARSGPCFHAAVRPFGGTKVSGSRNHPPDVINFFLQMRDAELVCGTERQSHRHQRT